MSARVEDWSISDHARFLTRSAIWLVLAALAGATSAGYYAHQHARVRATALVALGFARANGWLEPPDEIIARLSHPTFLDDAPNPPAGPRPEISAHQVPNSGYLRIVVEGTARARVQWTIETAVRRLVEAHAPLTEQAVRSYRRRRDQTARDLERLRAAMSQPHDGRPEVLVERMRIAQRIGRLEREQDDFRPDFKTTSTSTTHLVQPVAYATRSASTGRAGYGALFGWMVALTILYLRASLRRPGQARPG